MSARILILSYYFEPDLSAGSFRTTPLVAAVSEQGGAETEIEVLTTAPNRYRSYSVDTTAHERRGNVTIYRFRLPGHDGGMLGQAIGFCWFAVRVLWHVVGRRYDLVFATSSRLMTAVLGAVVAAWKGAPLYLDIRDLFVDTMRHILSIHVGAVLIPVFAALERWSFSRAARINLVSRGFEPYMREVYPNQRFSWFTNGIDQGFAVAGCGRHRDVDAPLRIVYAGNIGDGQGLHAIVPRMAKLAAGRLHFSVLGDGGRRAQLARAVEADGVENLVALGGPRSRAEVAVAYADADVLFLHLNDYDAFGKVLPSKVFEYAATGKPILAGVGGHAAHFLRSEVANSQVFPPCDAAAGLAALGELVLGFTDRSAFIQMYSRDVISKRMADDILGTMASATAREAG